MSAVGESDVVCSLLVLIRLASCMLASGSDDGTFSIRDLRLLKVRYAFYGVYNVPHYSVEHSKCNSSPSSYTSYSTTRPLLEGTTDLVGSFFFKTRQVCTCFSHYSPN